MFYTVMHRGHVYVAGEYESQQELRKKWHGDKDARGTDIYILWKLKDSFLILRIVQLFIILKE